VAIGPEQLIRDRIPDERRAVEVRDERNGAHDADDRQPVTV